MLKKTILATSLLYCGSFNLSAHEILNTENEVVECREHDIREQNDVKYNSLKTEEKKLHITDDNYVYKVALPDGSQGNVLRVTSSSNKQFVINSNNVVADSSMFVDKGDEYLFQYHPRYHKWQLIESPINYIKSMDLDNGIIPTPTKPNTEVVFYNGNWISEISLPPQGKQGDLIKINSSAAYISRIKKDHTDLMDNIDLQNNHIYEFIFNEENKQWQLYKQPNIQLSLNDIKDGKININSYKTTVLINDGEEPSILNLPYYKYAGQRIIIKNNSSTSFFVYLNETERELVQSNDVVSFKANEKWVWQRETESVNMLLLYGHKHMEKLGSHEKAQEGLISELSYVNDSLENSKAKYRYRLARIDVVQTPDDWTTLNDALSTVRSIPYVQTLIQKHSIDMIYYEATSSNDGYCGLAYVPGNTATGKLGCKAMGHELGHNWNIKHFAEESSWFNVGYREEATLVGGNAIPFYSTPNVISPNTRMPLGLYDKVDAIRVMNDRIPSVIGSNINKYDASFFIGKSYKGDDLRALPAPSEAQCLIECADDEQCIGYSYNINNDKHNKNHCWLHYAYDVDNIVEQKGTNTAYLKERGIGNAVTLYEDANYNGKSINLSESNNWLGDLNFTDIVSSIKIPKDWTITLYEDANYNGKSINLSESNNWLGDLNFNDIVSSIRVTKYTKTPDAHIAGYNNEHLTNVSREQCQVACSEQSWCQSLDYYNDSNACDLSDANAAEVGGLKVGKYGYDHYSIK